MAPSLPLKCSLEVADALAAGQPVVALESTIIAHGLPHPENAKTAQLLEQTIRDRGAVPATIAVLEGVATVGLNEAELAHITNPNTEILKLSRRDLPFAFSQNRTGATTVATTMLIAAAAGIRVFATGGIGGVHRSAEVDFDISADLPELGRSDVAVICAGPKAILNIPATLEYLETLGVPVIGYRCDMMPAFWSQSADLRVDYRLDSAAEIADLCIQKWRAGLNGGVLIANPIPQVNQIDPAKIETAITDALAIAYEKGYFEDEGLYVTLEAQANWKVLLDRVIDGQLDGAHMLAGQPLGATIGFGTQSHIITAFSMDLNGNGITVSNSVWDEMKKHVPHEDGKHAHGRHGGHNGGEESCCGGRRREQHGEGSFRDGHCCDVFCGGVPAHDLLGLLPLVEEDEDVVRPDAENHEHPHEVQKGEVL